MLTLCLPAIYALNPIHTDILSFFLSNSRFIALLIHVVLIHPYTYLMFPSEKYLFSSPYAI